MVENILDRAKIPVQHVTAAIEDELLLPYVTGASLSRWGFKVAGFYVAPHTAETGMEALSLETLKREFPKTFEYFKQFQRELAQRSLHRRWGKDKPFYSMYDIGLYTFAPFKVAWKRTTKQFSAAVLSTIEDPVVGRKVVVPNGKVMIVAFDLEDDAHFFCGVLNSGLSRSRINRSITSEAHRDIINVIPLEHFDEKKPLHLHIAMLSKSLHETTAVHESREVKKLEAELDGAVAELWGISKSQAAKERGEVTPD